MTGRRTFLAASAVAGFSAGLLRAQTSSSHEKTWLTYAVNVEMI